MPRRCHANARSRRSSFVRITLPPAEEGSIERLVQLLSDEDDRVVDASYRTISLATQRSENVQDAICFSSVLPILLQKARARLCASLARSLVFHTARIGLLTRSGRPRRLFRRASSESSTACRRCARVSRGRTCWV